MTCLLIERSSLWTSCTSQTCHQRHLSLPVCRRVKMTRLRMRVAERLKGAQNTYAMLTTFNEVDMTAIMELRNTFKVRL